MKLLSLVLAICVVGSSWASSFNGWNKIKEQNGVTVYSQKLAGSPVFSFGGKTIVNASAQKVFNVLMDQRYRKEWVDRLNLSKTLSKKSPYDYVLYQDFDLPWPVSNRDFVYHGKAYKDELGRVHLDMTSVQANNSPKSTGVRAHLHKSFYILTDLGKGKTQIEVGINSDPKGLIPGWLANLIQRSWPLKTLKGIRAQIKKGHAALTPLPKAL